MGKTLTIDEMKRILHIEIEKSKKHSSFYSYVGVDRSKELSKEVSLEELRKQEIELKSKKKTDFDPGGQPGYIAKRTKKQLDKQADLTRKYNNCKNEKCRKRIRRKIFI